MAHPVVSFQFGDNDHVAFSIELRRQVGQEYSTLAGLYKTHGLIYLVGAERDLVRVRTNYRNEDIYLYRTVMKPARARAIFLDYLRSLNALHKHPAFYNELTSNCTTNVRVHTLATAVGKPPPWDWRMLTNGYADQMLYERGDLVGQLAFADLRKQALVDERPRRLMMTQISRGVFAMEWLGFSLYGCTPGCHCRSSLFGLRRNHRAISGGRNAGSPPAHNDSPNDDMHWQQGDHSHTDPGVPMADEMSEIFVTRVVEPIS
jgi:hypothetical protein